MFNIFSSSTTNEEVHTDKNKEKASSIERAKIGETVDVPHSGFGIINDKKQAENSRFVAKITQTALNLIY